MEIQEIEVTIDADGNVQIHVQGASGTACLSLTADLEAALGEVEERDMTAEAYDDPQQQSIEQRHHTGF